MSHAKKKGFFLAWDMLSLAGNQGSTVSHGKPDFHRLWDMVTSGPKGT
jgi:hypothetical protein